MTRKKDKDFAIAIQKRVDAINLPAEKRYAMLVKVCPEFLQRFPQHMIASYLGDTKETLNRIHNHAVKK